MSSDRKVLFTVGSVLRGDDAAGPMLARICEESPVEGWEVIDGGQTPEDDLVLIRRARPGRLVLVDAADMGLEPGSVRAIGPDEVATQALITTHSLPIGFLLGQLEEHCEELLFLGIQPKDTSFFMSLTPEVMNAVRFIYDWLVAGADPSVFGSPGHTGPDQSAER